MGSVYSHIMGVSLKKVLLALNSTILLVTWILMLSFKFYPRDRSAFMFVGTYTLWMVTGLAHLKVFKLKAKLALLFCQSAISLALAITDTVNRSLEKPTCNQPRKKCGRCYLGASVDHFCYLLPPGYRPSAIGVQIRDQYGVSQSKYVTGNKILRVLKAQGMAPEIPEDLYFLIKKAVTVRKHLEKNRKDKHGKFRLILIESRIHRLARYYKTNKVLAPTWKYDSTTASALVA